MAHPMEAYTSFAHHYLPIILALANPSSGSSFSGPPTSSVQQVSGASLTPSLNLLRQTIYLTTASSGARIFHLKVLPISPFPLPPSVLPLLIVSTCLSAHVLARAHPPAHPEASPHDRLHGPLFILVPPLRSQTGTPDAFEMRLQSFQPNTYTASPNRAPAPLLSYTRSRLSRTRLQLRLLDFSGWIRCNHPCSASATWRKYATTSSSKGGLHAAGYSRHQPSTCYPSLLP